MTDMNLLNRRVRRVERRRETEAGRIRLSSNLTLYVRSDGNDANTGQTNDAAGAFATIQRAINAACRDYESGNYSLTIQIQDGTWPHANTIRLNPHLIAGGVVLQGNPTTPSNCTIQGDTEGMWLIGVEYASAAHWSLNGIRLQRGSATNVQAVVARFNPVVRLYNMDFGAVGSGAHMLASERAQINTMTAYTVSGGAGSHANANLGSYIGIAGQAITFVGSPSIGRWAVSQRESHVLHLGGGSLSGIVTISTERYQVLINASVEGIANMPGAGGSFAFGGQAL